MESSVARLTTGREARLVASRRAIARPCGRKRTLPWPDVEADPCAGDRDAALLANLLP